MITMAESASAVCLTLGCNWTASGPRSATAAMDHDVDHLGSHDIRLIGGFTG